MAKGSMRRFDTQAKYALYASVAGLFGLVGLAALVMRNYRKAEVAVVYSRDSMFAPVVFIATAVTLLLAATAAMMGFNSAGQKRNEKNKQSWIAFFVGTATASLAIIVFSVFWFYKLKI